MSVIELGSLAPNFSLFDQNNHIVTLDSFRGKKVFIYFYPKADTPGCTTQACSLKEAEQDLTGVEIIGISPDLPEKLANFDDKYKLNFTLLSDPDHQVLQAYGAWGQRSLYGKKFMGVIRSACLVDEEGKIIKLWPKISPKQTVEKLVSALNVQS